MRMQSVNNITCGFWACVRNPLHLVLRFKKKQCLAQTASHSHHLPRHFHGSRNCSKQIFPLAQLCNSDPKAHLRLIYRNLLKGSEFNALIRQALWTTCAVLRLADLTCCWNRLNGKQWSTDSAEFPPLHGCGRQLMQTSTF